MGGIKDNEQWLKIQLSVLNYLQNVMALLVGAAEYTDYIFAEE